MQTSCEDYIVLSFLCRFYINSDLNIFTDHPFSRISFSSSEFNSPICTVYCKFSFYKSRLSAISTFAGKVTFSALLCNVRFPLTVLLALSTASFAPATKSEILVILNSAIEDFFLY